MKYIILLVTLAFCALASPAVAAEVGECAPQKPGPYADKACRIASGTGTRVWRELAPPSSSYTDGHPEILGDEPQTFVGEGVSLKCKGNVVVGEVTSFTTNAQYMHEYKCELLAPFRAKCGNVGEDQIDTLPEAGVFEDGPEGTVINRLGLEATFTCGGLPASIAGGYVGTVLARKGVPIINKQVHKYTLFTGGIYGEQTLTLTVGLISQPVTMTGEQEDRVNTPYLVIQGAR
jgi:hypothetical protein